MFGRLISSTTRTKPIFLGSPEAEAESLATSRMPLHKVYEDFHGLSDALSAEKFIILARKGCGKSAFAEYIQYKSEDNANFFCSFIKPNGINLELIVQLGKDSGSAIEKETLFKWIIYTKIIDMVTNNEAIKLEPAFEHLTKFIRKNRGYIHIDSLETKETIQKYGFEIDIEHFKRFFTAKYKRDFEIKQTKAPFYKLIPHLEVAIKDLLLSAKEIANDNAYSLFFDDLDIDYHSSKDPDKDSLLGLLRVAKYVNNDVFGKNAIPAKVVILLRSDIAKALSTYSADSAKVFGSYAITIDWYETGYGKDICEDKLTLKRFINKRIAHAMQVAGLEFNKADPWTSLVVSEGFEKSSFDFVVNYTLFRPRDIILFFKPLADEFYKLPLNKPSLYVLSKKYAEELISELKNELSAFYTETEIENILSSLNEINHEDPCPYSRAITILENKCPTQDPTKLLLDLFNRSTIGTRAANGYLYFKFREAIGGSDAYTIPPTSQIVLQKGICTYCERKQQG